MQTFYKICLILMIVGGINWGLVGLFQFDFVGWLLGGSASIWSRIVFTLVGLAALCGIPGLFSDEDSSEGRKNAQGQLARPLRLTPFGTSPFGRAGEKRSDETERARMLKTKASAANTVDAFVAVVLICRCPPTRQGPAG